MKDKSLALILLCILALADISAWSRVLGGAPPRSTQARFLDVGQGDAVLLELGGGARILVDAGPDASVSRALERAGGGKRGIDLAVITHPEADHFGGFNHILGGYRIGAFIVNGRGREEEIGAWTELMGNIEERGIPLIALREGDVIRYGPSRMDILSPARQLLASQELNDGALVAKVRTPDLSLFLSADIDAGIEVGLRSRYDLSADVLKAGHHGSKYSSSMEFVSAVAPELVVVSAGARNSYGHPAPEALARLGSAGAAVFRTDLHGTVTIRKEGKKLVVSTERNAGRED